MKIDEREVISQEIVKAKMEQEFKRNCKRIPFCILASVMFVWMGTWFTPFDGAVVVLEYLLYLGGAFIFLCVPIFFFYQRNIIKNELFAIVEDTLVELERDKYSPLTYSGRRDNDLVDVFRFRQYGRLKVKTGKMPYASVGDEFYLLIIQVRNPTIKQVYSKKIYRLEDNKTN